MSRACDGTRGNGAEVAKRSAPILVARTRARIETCDVHTARARFVAGDVVSVDVRESDELAAEGRIHGSLWVPRGTLEFRADPNFKRHQLGLERERPIVVHSGSGERSALATATLSGMGYRYDAELDGVSPPSDEPGLRPYDCVIRAETSVPSWMGTATNWRADHLADDERRMMMIGRMSCAVLAAGLAMVAIVPTIGDAVAAGGGTNAVLEWNETAGRAARVGCLSPANDPLHEARMYALTHIAIHDALNAIDRRFEPYAYDAQALAGTSADAAVASAAHDALAAALGDLPSELFPPSCGADGLAVVDAAYDAALAAIPDGAAKTNGIDTGRAAAAAIVALRADDHANDAPLVDTSPRGGPPGEYQFTPGTPFAFAPKWGSVTPFALKDSSQFASGPPYPLTSKRYADDFNEVKRLGGGGTGDPTPSARTDEQTEIALFWVESSPLSWNRMARMIAADRGLDMWESARLFGLLNMGMTDGYIGTFQEKYVYNFWRPVTAIHRAAEDGNPDTAPAPDWQPLVGTPPIPDHDSGHSVEGGVAATILRRVLGTDRVSFEVCSLTLPAGQTCDDPSPVLRSFARLSDAADENGESRILVGFHFRHAVVDGIAHGDKIGNWTVAHNMEPVTD